MGPLWDRRGHMGPYGPMGPHGPMGHMDQYGPSRRHKTQDGPVHDCRKNNAEILRNNTNKKRMDAGVHTFDCALTDRLRPILVSFQLAWLLLILVSFQLTAGCKCSQFDAFAYYRHSGTQPKCAQQGPNETNWWCRIILFYAYWARIGSVVGQCPFSLGLPWAMMGPRLSPSWAHDGHKLEPSHGPMMGPSLGPSWASDGPKLGWLSGKRNSSSSSSSSQQQQ